MIYVKTPAVVSALLLSLLFAGPASMASAATTPKVYASAEGWRNPVRDPSAIYLGNGGAPYVSALSWSSWTGTYAAAQGNRGHHHADVGLGVVKTHDGTRYFSEMVWDYTANSGKHAVYVWRTGHRTGDFYQAAYAKDCYPLSNENTCYEPGEYCRSSDNLLVGVAGDQKLIVCENNNGLRWEPISAAP